MTEKYKNDPYNSHVVIHNPQKSIKKWICNISREWTDFHSNGFWNCGHVRTNPRLQFLSRLLLYLSSLEAQCEYNQVLRAQGDSQHHSLKRNAYRWVFKAIARTHVCGDTENRGPLYTCRLSALLSPAWQYRCLRRYVRGAAWENQYS